MMNELLKSADEAEASEFPRLSHETRQDIGNQRIRRQVSQLVNTYRRAEKIAANQTRYEHATLKEIQRQPKSEKKADIRQVTGQTRVEDLVTESKALEASLKKARKAADAGYKAGKKDATIAAEAKAEKLRKKLAKATNKKQKKQLLHKLRTAEKAAAAGYKKGKRDAVDYYIALRNKQRELKRQRERFRKALAAIKRAKKILKAPKASIDHVFKGAMKHLVDGINPRNLSKKSMESRRALLRFLERNWEQIDNIPAKLMRQLNDRVANDYTLEELEEIAQEVKRLEKMGRVKFRLKNERAQRVQEELKAELSDAARRGEPLPERIGAVIGKGNKKVGQKVKGARQALRAESLRPSRLLDLLDGGKGTFDGIWHRTFYDAVNEAEETKLRILDSRYEGVELEMERLGITMGDLIARLDDPELPSVAKDEDGNDVEWTLQRLIGVYCASQNERATQAIMHGNQLTEQDIALIIRKLSPEARALGDAIIADYESRWDALQEAYIRNTNNEMPKEENYTPLIRMDYVFETPEKQLMDEVAHRMGVKKPKVEKGFTHKRVDIPKEFQTPIDLDVVKNWRQQVDIQEHYIAYAGTVNQLNNIMGSLEIRKAIDLNHGKAVRQAINDYVQRLANPNIFLSYKELDKLSRRLRRNVAAAALSFNLVTFMKQLPSLAFFLGDTDGAHLTASAMAFAKDPMAMIEFVRSLDAQVAHVAIERELEEMAKAMQGQAGAINNVRKIGMKPIRFFDMIARTIGWNAVYQQAVDKNFSHDEAVRMARNATLRTQPAGNVKDLPALYTHNEGLNWMLMFSNQLNQIWNMATYDSARQAKAGDYKQAMLRGIGMGISGLTIWMLSKKRIPDDIEDVLDVGLSQFLGSVPLLGSGIMGYRNRFFGQDHPVIGPATKTVGALSEGDIGRATGYAIEFGAVATGLPYVAGRRFVKTFVSTPYTGKQDPLALIGGSPRK
jgi:hypothetical protein